MTKQVKMINPVQNQMADGLRKKVCAYCRVSTDMADQLGSYETQKEYYEELIRRRAGWTFVGIYADYDRTGTKESGRIEFQQMLKDCEMGKIDMILTKSITRFARNTVDCMNAVRRLKELKIDIFFEKENIHTLSEKSEMLLTIYSSVAQAESESISTNARWAIQKRFQDGSYHAGNLAYGYRKNENKEIEIAPEEAEAVRFIYQEYLSGSGIHTITKELNRRKIPTKCGARSWTYKPVSGILNNIIYTGTMLYQKYYTTETLPFREKRNYGERPMVMVENNHPPIISKEDFEKVQKLLAYRNTTGEAEKSNRYDFTGKIVCGSCGAGFIRRTDRKKSGYKVCTWGCAEHTLSKDRCGQKAVKEEHIKEKFVLLWNKLQSGKEEIFPPLLESLEKIRLSGGILEKIEAYDNRITEWIRQSQSLNQMAVREYIDSAFYIEKNNELHKQIREAKEKRQRLLDQSETRKKTEETLALLRLLERESDFLEEYDGRLFLAMVEKIIIYPNNEMTFRLKNGLELTERY